MNVLILGSGGREHALAWKIRQSEALNQLYVAPGNAGTAQIATNIAVDINDFTAVKNVVLTNEISLVLVGPEDPLVNGIVDFFANDDSLKKVAIVGPNAEAAQLEGSKEYAKIFMEKHGIPTARYKSFTDANIQEGFDFLDELQAPYVLKADGLAAGKGVLILDDVDVAKIELRRMLQDKKFGAASSKVVIEEFLSGIELSVFVLTDGKDYQILPNAKDYKRIGEGDKGLNTGGMGAVSPVPFADEAFMEKVEQRIVKPTIKGIHSDNLNYKGFVFIGLIAVKGEPFVIEYNVRMGDPETEVVLPRIESDLLSVLLSLNKGTLLEHKIVHDPRTACTVMMVSGGYPESYEKGKKIEGLENENGSIIFHAGTTQNGKDVVTNGGRVLAVTSFGESMQVALKHSYNKLTAIKFDKAYYRKDIGFDL